VETNDTYHILAMKTRGIVGGRKSYGKKIHPAAKDNGLTSEAELYTMQGPLCMTLGYPTPMLPRKGLLASIVS